MRGLRIGASRRMFLRGAAGVVVGLPLLESLLPREARGAEASIRRFIGFLTGNGVARGTFWPDQLGSLDAGSLVDCALNPLAAHATRMILPRGIHTVPVGYSQNTAGDDHQKGWGHRLTAAPLDWDTLFATGISIDQRIAQQLNPGGRPALTLTVGPRPGSMVAHSSYLGPNQPVTPENNPWLAYQDLMGLAGLGEEQLARLVARRESVLDLLEAEFDELHGRDIGRADKHKLDMHLDTIRDLEVDMFEGLVACELPPERAQQLAELNPDTVEFDAQYPEVGRMQMDLLALAIACGSTVAATLQWHHGVAGPIFNWDGLEGQYNHHKLSHGNTADDNTGAQIPDYLIQIARIDEWYAKQLAYLCDKLAAYEEGDATVLDNSAVCWLNDLSDGLSHSYTNMPHVIVGGCGGYLKTGQHVMVTASEQFEQTDDAGHDQLLTTILNAVGATADDGGPIESFGDPMHATPGELVQLKA
ncbi:MAG: DUF1552 domain-containing protein [Deltaproteobacteria bacterium]|nr:DUF1552 domain-containing protein [Nannocystaceae bacterium]